MTENVTNLNHARVLRHVGLPLNTPVIEGDELPKAAHDAWVKALKLAIKFRDGLYACKPDCSRSTYERMRKAFVRFEKHLNAVYEAAQKASVVDASGPECIAFWLLNDPSANLFEFAREWRAAFDGQDRGKDIDPKNLWPFK